MIRETGEFVINLTTKELTYATDWCGVKSGRDVDKFKEMNLTAMPGEKLYLCTGYCRKPGEFRVPCAERDSAWQPQYVFGKNRRCHD